MRVLISTPVWGKGYRDLFLNHSLPGLLGEDVKIQVVAPREDAIELSRCGAPIDEVMGVSGNPPASSDPEKYAFATHLQNFAIRSAKGYDAIIFNYADFVWAAGSLRNVIESIASADLLLGFCLPVSMDSKPKPNMPPRELAAFALDNLHPEARYRYWDASEFTRFPSYLLFDVPEQGAVVRAFHQTALACRTSILSEIEGGTLDGVFTGELAKRGNVAYAADSDRIMVASLHDGRSHPGARGGDRHAELKRLKARCSPEQRAFANTPLRVKRADGSEAEWRRVEHESGIIVSRS